MKTRWMAIALLFVLVSCNGGGGGGSPSGTPATPVPLRMFQNGDRWTYAVSGSVNLPGSGVSFSGTTDRWIDTGSSTKKIIHNEVTLNAAGTTTQTGADTYFDQDADGNVTFFGDANSVNGRVRLDTSATGFLRLKSPIRLGDQVDSGTITFDDGSTLSSSFQVIGTETITVPAGTFDTYKVDATEVHTNPTQTLTLTQAGSYWIDPKVGIIQYKGTETKRNASNTVLYTMYLQDDPNTTSSVENYGFQLTRWTPAGAIPVAAPRGVSAAPSGGGITLEWDPVPNATGYKVYRPANSGDPLSSSISGTIPASSTPSFTDPSPNSGTTYYYRVTAVGPAGEGPPSVEVSAQISSSSPRTDWSTQKSNTTVPLTAVVAKPDLIDSTATHIFAAGGGCNILDFLVLCGGVLLHSADGGTTWTQESVDPMTMLSGLSFSDADHGWVVGENGVIQATTNGGTTWLPQSSGTTQNLTGVYFLPAGEYGWAIGFGGTVILTTDNGAHWQPQISGTQNLLSAVMFTDNKHGWAAGSGASNGTDCQGTGTINCATILYTDTGGTSWTLKNSGTTTANYHALSFPTDDQHGWIMGAGGAVLYTADGGTSDWVPQTTTTTSLHGAFFTDNLNGWGVGWGSIIHTSTGGGGTSPASTDWKVQYGPDPNLDFRGKTLLLAVTAVPPVSPDPSTPVYAVGWSGTILHSDNGQN
jgi:photosystem II stability/assembly factor-like uncharacterized protein